MADVWDAIRDDPKLARARKLLSMDELRTICRHAWANPADPEKDRRSIEDKLKAAFAAQSTT